MTDVIPRPAAATVAEIESQPEIWAQALALPDAELAGLPQRGESVLALGCGTSYYILEAYARRRQQLGHGLSRAAIASEVDDPETYDRILYLSRSGTTSELLRAHEHLRAGVSSVALCGTPGSPLTDLVDDVVLLPFADETSVVQTRFATTALNVLRRSIGDDVADLPGEAAAVLGEPLPVEPGLHDHLVFLGTGWTAGLAEEAALKCRESALVHAESYAIGEYRHGPIAVADTRSLIWSFAPVPADVRDAIAETGAQLVEATHDPVVELVLIHRLAMGIAQSKGIDPDRPRYLSRSVVLG